MYASCTATTDELSPLAGTVGIELVPQTLALTAGSQADSGSATQQRAAGANTQTASAPAEKQQQQQPRPQEWSQQQPLAETPRDEAPIVHQQSREASHGSHLADGSDPALVESEATAVVDSECTSQQHIELQHWSHGSGSASRQHESGHDSDDEHAVLIAANEHQSCDDNQGPLQAPEANMSKQQSAAAERQRVWYKEQAVQLTILG